MKSSHLILALALSASLHFTACQSVHSSDAAMPTTNQGYQPTYWGDRNRIPAAMPTEGKVKGVPTYGVPYQLPGRSVWISSFVFTKTRWLFSDSDPFSEGGLASSGAAYANQTNPTQLHSIPVRWHDAVFSTGQGTESWSLLGKRGFISNWWLMADDEQGAPLTRFQVFAAVVDDTNKDGFLDDKDASVAIFTDGEGRNARFATPEHMQLAAVHYMPESRILGFEVREDADGNGKFENDDPVRFYFRHPFQEETSTKPWHKPEFQEALEGRYR